jgi:hypothetical protein
VGTVIGGRIAGRLDAATLRRGFGWFVLGVGLVVTVTELPSTARLWGALGAAVVAAVMVTWVRSAQRRHDDDTGGTPDDIDNPDPTADTVLERNPT